MSDANGRWAIVETSRRCRYRVNQECFVSSGMFSSGALATEWAPYSLRRPLLLVWTTRHVFVGNLNMEMYASGRVRDHVIPSLFTTYHCQTRQFQLILCLKATSSSP
jgi:hypothetical protein